MGKRFTNNLPTKSQGFVHTGHRLDLRLLKRIGLLADGKLAHWADYPHAGLYVADLRSDSESELVVDKYRQPVQVIPLVYRKMNVGGRRWFFLDEEGKRCETLYLYQNRYMSRAAARLTYRTQSNTSLIRWRNERTKIDWKLKGDVFVGPARGKHRKRLEQRKKRIEAAFEMVGGALTGELLERRKLNLIRRNASNNRLNDARKAMQICRDLSREEVLACFGPLLDEIPVTSRRVRPEPPPMINGRAASKKELPLRIVDLGVLSRLGYVKLKAISADQLGWPKDWLGSPDRRVFFLIDMRNAKFERAWFVTEDAGAITNASFFWIVKIKGAFGRFRLMFQGVHDSSCAEYLIYKDGVFSLPQG